MSEMKEHYEPGHEVTRLSAGEGRLEWLRTVDVFDRYAAAPPACVLDVGGGPGAYALHLARRGYAAHLLDPVPLHIEQAEQAAKRQPDHPLKSARVGDARHLPFATESADIVLLLGPLYHLTEAADRASALREALRVLRRGGLLIAAGISRFASTCDGLRHGYLREPEFESIVERDLADGQHRNHSNRAEWFTTAYFHRPAELATEVTAAGFAVDEVLAVEGPAWLVPGLEDWLTDDRDVGTLLRAIRRIETEPSLLGASAHFLVVAQKS